MPHAIVLSPLIQFALIVTASLLILVIFALIMVLAAQDTPTDDLLITPNRKGNSPSRDRKRNHHPNPIHATPARPHQRQWLSKAINATRCYGSGTDNKCLLWAVNGSLYHHYKEAYKNFYTTGHQIGNYTLPSYADWSQHQDYTLLLFATKKDGAPLLPALSSAEVSEVSIDDKRAAYACIHGKRTNDESIETWYQDSKTQAALTAFRDKALPSSILTSHRVLPSQQLTKTPTTSAYQALKQVMSSGNKDGKAFIEGTIQPSSGENATRSQIAYMQVYLATQVYQYYQDNKTIYLWHLHLDLQDHALRRALMNEQELSKIQQETFAEIASKIYTNNDCIPTPQDIGQQLRQAYQDKDFGPKGTQLAQLWTDQRASNKAKCTEHYDQYVDYLVAKTLSKGNMLDAALLSFLPFGSTLDSTASQNLETKHEDHPNRLYLANPYGGHYVFYRMTPNRDCQQLVRDGHLTTAYPSEHELAVAKLASQYNINKTSDSWTMLQVACQLNTDDSRRKNMMEAIESYSHKPQEQNHSIAMHCLTYMLADTEEARQQILNHQAFLTVFDTPLKNDGIQTRTPYQIFIETRYPRAQKAWHEIQAAELTLTSGTTIPDNQLLAILCDHDPQTFMKNINLPQAITTNQQKHLKANRTIIQSLRQKLTAHFQTMTKSWIPSNLSSFQQCRASIDHYWREWSEACHNLIRNDNANSDTRNEAFASICQILCPTKADELTKQTTQQSQPWLLGKKEALVAALKAQNPSLTSLTV